MGEWKKVRIGEFLTESKEEAINSDSSRRITVRLNCRGVEHRKLKAEKDGQQNTIFDMLDNLYMENRIFTKEHLE